MLRLAIPARLTAGNSHSADLQIPKLNHANDFQCSQLYFSTKYSKLNYVYYWCVTAGEKKSVLN